MNGAEYIAEFLRQREVGKIFLMTGGACAFIIDAIARNPGTDYVSMHHEQSAAMAADAVWRTERKVGAAVATSGPGATNLLTGIACSYFDSIPSIHITGQVNMAESAGYMGAKVRQVGFQETDIVAMAKPVTKYAVQVNTVAELKAELTKAYNIAITGRMGPVLIDVPMNVQKEDAGDVVEYTPPPALQADAKIIAEAKTKIEALLAKAERPVVLFGAGVGLAGAEKEVEAWLKKTGLPFVSSWNGMTYFDHALPNYLGQIGVYGNRGANSILQNADALIVLGSRLDNRQRSGNSRSFVPKAKVFVVDVDAEEIKKYKNDGYDGAALDLHFAGELLQGLSVPALPTEWAAHVNETKTKHYGKNVSTFAEKNNTLSPYEVVRVLNGLIDDDAIVVADTGATVCWVYQMFARKKHSIFTAGGMSPMGYALPAAIGAATHSKRQVISINGDGGFQLNVQELQTAAHNKLPITIFVFNNGGYGIIKQFQDSYCESRHEATGRGYSIPDLGKIAEAYNIGYVKVEKLSDLTKAAIAKDGPVLVDVILHPNTLIEPKLEMGRPIHDQFPYMDRVEYAKLNRFIEE